VSPGYGGGLGEGEDAKEVWPLVVLEEEGRQRRQTGIHAHTSARIHLHPPRLAETPEYTHLREQEPVNSDIQAKETNLNKLLAN